MGIDSSKTYTIAGEDCARKDNYLYFVAREMNLIFKLDIDNHYSIDYFFHMPKEDGITDRLYNGILIQNNKMLLVPCNAQKIWIYDFNVQKWESIDLDQFMEPKLSSKFVGGEVYGSKAYLFGYYYEGILVVNLETKVISNLLVKERRELCSFWGQSTSLVDGKLYIANRVTNEILKINLKDDSYEKIRIGDDQEKYVGISFDGKDFWIVPHHGAKIYRWNGKEALEKVLIPSFYDCTEGFFNGICATERKLFLYSPKGKTCIIDREKDSTSIENKKVFYVECMEGVGIVVCEEGKVCIFGQDLSLLKEIKTQVSREMYIKCTGDLNLFKRVLYENRTYGLEEFIDTISKD